ncbi:MAG: hypothetical protein WCK27_14820 [Verrucomicrobiota bacterium]|nr:hypothetical protein [Verrucomicrobiota bacterium]
MKTQRDETLEEIWAIRRQIAKEFDYDPKEQVAHYQRKQKQLGAKIYRSKSEFAAASETLALRETPSSEH